MTTTRNVKWALGLLLLAAAAAVADTSAAGPDRVGANASAAKSQPASLMSISARGNARTVSVLIETSEPVAFTTVQADPLTLLLDLRNVKAMTAANIFGASVEQPISSVSIEDAGEAEGVPVTRIRVTLSARAGHRVRSASNRISLQVDRVASRPATAQGTMVPASPVEPPLQRAAVPVSFTLLEPPARGGPAEAIAVAAATVLRAVNVSSGPEGTVVTLIGNGRLLATGIREANDPPARLVIDFPGVRSEAPSWTLVRQGPVERVRIGLNSYAPLVTRVVFDLTKQSPYRIEYPNDRELRIVFQGASAGDLAASSRAEGAGGAAESARPGSGEARPGPVAPAPPAPVLRASDISRTVDGRALLRTVALAQPPSVAALYAPTEEASPEARREAGAAKPTAVPPVAPPAARSVPAASVSSTNAANAGVPSSHPPPGRAQGEPASSGAVVPPVAPEPQRAPAQPGAAAAAQQPAAPAPSPPVPAERPAPAPWRGGQVGAAIQGEKQYTGHPISMDFAGVDLRAVLRAFADISGLNIVIDPTVQGVVDVALRDVPWDQALEIILRANKLGYSVDGTIIRVAPLMVLADEEKQRVELAKQQALAGDLRVLTRALSYARAADMVALLTKSALSERGTVEIDARTNTLIITDLPARLLTASDLINTLDKAEPQVEIEARIVVTNREFARALGVQWGFSGRAAPELGNTTPLAFPNSGSITGRQGAPQQGSVSEGGVPVDTPGYRSPGTAVNLLPSNATSAVGLALGSVNGAVNLDVVLSALERQGKGRILQTPRVATQNNIEASITQGLEIPIQTVANNTVSVTFKQAALTLKVTPQITAADTVIMKIEVENASADFARQVNGIPPINTQKANTQVLVKDGATTVIGGIYTSTEQTTIDRTPLLHKIPLLGWLFRRDDVREESTELLIFITPRIIKGP